MGRGGAYRNTEIDGKKLGEERGGEVQIEQLHFLCEEM